MFYDPNDWYWIVAGDATKIYSSKRGVYVPASDATYVAWKDKGNVTSQTDSVASLGETLADAQVRPNDAALLDVYQEKQGNSVVVKLVFKLLFDLINRVNVLEGKPQITAAQARAYVKARM